jgi:transposase-like protein
MSDSTQAARTRRFHSPAFKAQAVAACSQPGVSLAAVALAHGINANLLRRWCVAQQRQQHPAEQRAVREVQLLPVRLADEVPHPVPLAPAPASPAPVAAAVDERAGLILHCAGIQLQIHAQTDTALLERVQRLVRRVGGSAAASSAP